MPHQKNVDRCLNKWPTSKQHTCLCRVFREEKLMWKGWVLNFWDKLFVPMLRTPHQFLSDETMVWKENVKTVRYICYKMDVWKDYLSSRKGTYLWSCDNFVFIGPLTKSIWIMMWLNGRILRPTFSEIGAVLFGQISQGWY